MMRTWSESATIAVLRFRSGDMLSGKKMEIKDLDRILALQLTIARLGEKLLCNWWNVDIAYKFGGADFLHRLTGKVMATLAIGEGLLQAAAQREAGLLAGIPEHVLTLFQPTAAVQVALHYRFRHFKAYPSDLPQALALLLDSERDWKIEELVAHRDELCTGAIAPQVEATAFGRLCKVPENSSPLDVAKVLALSFDSKAKGKLVLSYCRESHDA